MKIPEFFKDLTQAGIQPTLMEVQMDNVLLFDMHTQAKSHLRLSVYPNGEMKAYMRYGKVESIYDFEDLCIAVLGCMLGRDYINCSWSGLLKKRGLL